MNKTLITICVIMLFVPWTILILRTNDWALQSPVAENMILSYAVFMIFSGVFTIFSYLKVAKNNLMRVCLMVNSLYAVVGLVAFFQIVA